ncbi:MULTISPECIES: hypothetical protein [unclassified Microcoleus]|uniref:hypothetical protein n=1 Tax=unclassified Microcoleus TaxID=2642155 RepID=UPI002FD2A14C
MNFIEQLVRKFRFWRFKRNIRSKIYRFNKQVSIGKSESTRSQYQMREVEKSSHDLAIQAYLSKYKSQINGISTGWYPYLYEMIGELMENGLTAEDTIWAKEKHAEFRCSVKAKDKNKQLIFDKIIETYTNKINATCQFCDNQGINQEVNSWEYNLCLQHYLESKYDIEVDDEIQYYKEYFGEKDDQKTYKSISTDKYYILNELAFRKRAGLLHTLLKDKFLSDDSAISDIMYKYFEEEMFFDIELDDKYYESHFRFFDDSGTVIDKPEFNYYHPMTTYENIIKEICT